MRIALVNLTSGGLSGGYRKYLRKLVPLLERSPRVEAVSVFAHPAACRLMLPASADWHAWPQQDGLAGYSWLRAEIVRRKCDVVFVPTARFIKASDRPTVCMVRNMEPLIAPWSGNSLRDGLLNVVRASEARRACKRADRIIAVSQYVKDYVTSRWGISERRVGIAYHGIDPHVPGSEVRPSSIGPEFEHDGPFLFTAGSIRPARGLEDLIEALAHLKRVGKTYRLMVGGASDPATHSYRAHLDHLARSRGVEELVLYPGSLSASEMSWCFTRAAAFVMTSRVEACPNVALEAMAHGAVCISGDNPPMPEFFRDAARYYRSGDGRSLAAALLHLPRVEPHTQSAALARAADFTWRSTADRTINELELALAATSPRHDASAQMM